MILRALAALGLAAALSGCGPALLHRDHPLAGRAWDVREQRYVEPDALWARAAGVRHVLLGETHDNAEHHRLQRRALEALAAAGPARALAMEQFDSEHQAALDAARGADAEALADAGRFDRKGWNWPLYRDLVAFAPQRGWRLLAANLSRAELRAAAADAGKVAALPPAPAGLLQALERDMVDGHCGHRPGADTLARMMNGQRLRDARMASVLEDAGGPTVLLAGNGHVRRDRGVPLYLRGADFLAIAQVEVREGLTDPRDYLRGGFAGPDSYDVVLFTPRADREDPCAAFQGRIR